MIGVKMGLQWTIIATLLYSEIAIVLLLTLPIASPTKWNMFFKSKFFSYLSGQTYMYFIIVIGVLVLCLLDAIREIQICSNVQPSEHQHLDAKMQNSIRLFRAQRNFHICGFALFLLLVIFRLVQMISQVGTLLAQSQANFRQAQNATSTVKKLLDQQGASDKNIKKEISELKSQISMLEKNLDKEKKDKEAMKSQAKSINKEYDRLAEKHTKLQKKLTASGDGKKNE